MIATLAQLQWLRPDWLWALAALPVLAWWWWRRRSRGSIWKQAVDPHLLPHLLEQHAASRGLAAAVIVGLAFVLAVLALAGPSAREIQQPLWTEQAPLVVAVDLSSASRASDVPPSRVARARAKIATLLADRPGGQVGLVAYAGEAFTVAPLTSDSANVALFLDALDPGVMPVDGQRVDRAIAWSARLLAQAGFQHGSILLLADHATPAALAEASRVQARGYTVSVLGIGSAAGAPYRNEQGEIVVARRDHASLQRLAAAGGGRYAALSEGNTDLLALGVLDSPGGVNGGDKADATVTTRQDDGYWLLIPLMVLALFAFRRGAPVLLLVVCLWLPGQDVHAADLWQRPDQRAHRTMEEAAAAYRRGDFAESARLYGTLDNTEAAYNRGNALAREGDYPEALAAYDKALKASPEMADAIANRQAVEAAMKRKPATGKGDSNGEKSGASDKSSAGEQGRDQKNDESGRTGEDPDSSAGAGGERAVKSEPRDGDEGSGGQKDRSSPESGAVPQDAGAADAQAQQAADQAQRQRMQEALQRGGPENEESGNAAEAVSGSESADERERRIANEAWLRRIPDDPGGLLRRKFQLEYERRQREGRTD